MPHPIPETASKNYRNDPQTLKAQLARKRYGAANRWVPGLELHSKFLPALPHSAQRSKPRTVVPRFRLRRRRLGIDHLEPVGPRVADVERFEPLGSVHGGGLATHSVESQHDVAAGPTGGNHLDD